MFTALTTRLEMDIEAIRRAIDVHEHSRALFYSPNAVAGAELGPRLDPWEAVRRRDPGKLEWQIYDYCAAITRVYVIYSVFVDDLISEYLRLLPSLYERYEHLPPAVQKQHRIGVAQILQKLGDSGPYENIREGELVSIIASAVSGEGPYTLFERAFFVDSYRQNYRLEVLVRLFRSVGVDNIGARLASHCDMVRFVKDVRDDATTVEAELKNLVELRNAAAHSEVEDVIAGEDLHKLPDFILVLGKILAELLCAELSYRKYVLGQLLDLGSVTETHYGGFVAIIKAKPQSFARGTQVAVIGRTGATLTRVETIMRNDVEVESVCPSEGEEVGLRLNRKCWPGDALALIPPPPERELVEAGPPAEGSEELDPQAATGPPADHQLDN